MYVCILRGVLLRGPGKRRLRHRQGLELKNIHKHIKHINNYDTEINYYNKKSLNKKQ